MKKFSPFHLVNLSPWPFFTSLSFLSFAMGTIIMVRLFYCVPFIISLLFLLVSSFIWGRDIHREGCYEGSHNVEVLDGFKIGMIFFILSECFFFLGMFWCYIHLAESPDFSVGGVWPPLGVTPFDPSGIPFLNTILLVSSGVSVTWAHHALEEGLFKMSLVGLIFTIFLGFIFTLFQLTEYFVASFTFSCSAYSSIYFMGTGFHGLHVIIGTVLLFICLVRFSFLVVSPLHATGFECSVWYWHFVDIVWFFLYLVFYWWGV
uniref:Cytochrome c oxidase subunit 3 n=1 Tax=Histiostoma blomquisti TaxID=1902798 RepID=A0A342Y123_9ACAR|nr:cytochrome c oxidase subunit III [Histiostoma blomquisti]AOR08475.1 cytochrome c oxidase subunit III [Histiostoma blomquisti]